MTRFFPFAILLSGALVVALSSFAEGVSDDQIEQEKRGYVVEYVGKPGELVMSRDGVVYVASTGSTLQAGDIVRATKSNSTVIQFDGCELLLPEMKDILLDEKFCEDPTPLSMAAIASENPVAVANEVIASGTRAPLIIGGISVAGGGILAATGSGNGGVDVTSASATSPTAANTSSSTP